MIKKQTLTIEETIKKLYHSAGPELEYDNWWPGDSPWSIAVTAILTQFTRWERAWQAYQCLLREGLDTPRSISGTPLEKLESLIQPAGTFRRKARTLHNLADFVVNKLNGNILNLRKLPVEEARKFLLAIPGIGRETADSILLYACQMPVFVIDEYTRRILHYHGLYNKKGDEWFFQQAVEKVFKDATKLARFHAMFVMLGKRFCRKSQPKCSLCPWKILLPSDNSTSVDLT